MKYQTTKILSQVLSGIGWIGMAASIATAVNELTGFGADHYTLGLAVAIIPVSLMLVVAGQLSSAFIDNTNANIGIYELMQVRKNIEPTL